MSRRIVKAVIAVGLSLPFLWLAWALGRELLQPGSVFGPDPAEEIVKYLGTWSIRSLLFVLAIAPAHRSLSFPILPARRLAGLFVFAYVVAHVTAYVWLLAGLDLSTVVSDLSKRPYIIAGAVAAAALVPLAVTSTRAWRRRLGFRWVVLHRLIYVIVPVALVHLWWLTKDGYMDVVVYATVFGVLMAERGVRVWRKPTAAAEA